MTTEQQNPQAVLGLRLTPALVPEPGLPWAGSRIEAGQAVGGYTYRVADNRMAPHFPAGTGVLVERCCHRRDLVPGVYVAINGPDRVYFGRLAAEGMVVPRRIWLTCDNSAAEWWEHLSWSDPEWSLWRVTHYIGLPAQ